MSVPSSILVAAIIIAGAILFIFRWEIGGPGIFRLDRWTGAIAACDFDLRRPGKAICE